MYLDYDAAREASKRGFEQLCLDGTYFGDGRSYGYSDDYKQFPGIGASTTALWVSNSNSVITEFFEPIWLGSYRLGNVEVTRVLCFEVGSNIDAKFIDRNTGWEVILQPGRNLVAVPEVIGRGDMTFHIRCKGGKCDSALSERTGFEITGFRLSDRILYDDILTRYWSQMESIKISEFESILREIHVNWLDWYDRVDRGHPSL